MHSPFKSVTIFNGRCEVAHQLCMTGQLFHEPDLLGPSRGTGSSTKYFNSSADGLNYVFSTNYIYLLFLLKAPAGHVKLIQCDVTATNVCNFCIDDRCGMNL